MKMNFPNFLIQLFIIISTSDMVYVVYAQGAYEGELLYYCNSIKDCRNFGYVCKEKRCQCNESYVVDQDKKRCLGGVDQKCVYDEHCIIGAYCMNQSICKCKEATSQVLENGLVCGSATKHNQWTAIKMSIIGTTQILLVYYLK